MPLLSSALLRTQSDERLLALVGAGHERAFEAIVHRYRKPLERYCSRALSRSQGEDVVQQVLLKAWQALDNGAEVRSLRPWLFRIAQTTIIEAVKRSGFDYEELARSLGSLDGPEAEFEKRAVIRQTLKGLAALPAAQREALLRTAVHGESRAEIAAALGVSEGAVRQLLYRARSSLRSVVTAATPITFVTWLARPVEVGGLAKASAIVAGVGVAAAGPVAVHDLALDRPSKAPVRVAPVRVDKPAAPQPRVNVGYRTAPTRTPPANLVVAKTSKRGQGKKASIRKTRAKAPKRGQINAANGTQVQSQQPAEEVVDDAGKEKSVGTKRSEGDTSNRPSHLRNEARRAARDRTIRSNRKAVKPRRGAAGEGRVEKVKQPSRDIEPAPAGGGASGPPADPGLKAPPDKDANGPPAKDGNAPPDKEPKSPQA